MENRSLSNRAFDRELTTLAFKKIATEQQAEFTAPFARGTVGGRAAIKPEQIVQVVLRHADAGISNRDFNEVTTVSRADRDHTAGRRELDRITDEITNHREQHVALGLSTAAGAVGLQRQLLGCGQLGCAIQCFAHEVCQVDIRLDDFGGIL